MVSKQKILIVDDDNNIAELISLYLTKECFDTMIVNDGESVMPAMETFAPNLILLDLMRFVVLFLRCQFWKSKKRFLLLFLQVYKRLGYWKQNSIIYNERKKP